MFRKDTFGITKAMNLDRYRDQNLKNLRRMKTRLNLRLQTIVLYAFYIALISYLVHKIISTYWVYNQIG